MPRVTRADLLSRDTGEGAQVIEALAPLATGVNEDGTPYTMPSTGLVQKWRDEFSGSAINAAEWTVRTSGGATVTVAGSNVVLTTGTTSGAIAEIESVRTFSPGVRLLATLASISQRIVNQEFTIELVEDGAPSDGGSNRALWRISGTGTSSGDAQQWGSGDAGTLQAITTLTASSSPSIFEIDLSHEETWFYNMTPDAQTIRQAALRLTRKQPDPNKRYRIRLRAKNTGTAASSTTFNIDAVAIEDYAFLPVEISRGRGSVALGETLGVTVTGGLTRTFIGNTGVNALMYADTSTPLGAAATFTGTSKDCGQTTLGTTGATPGFRRVSASTLADAAGTLYLEISNDATTWHRIKQFPTTQNIAGGLHIAELNEPMNYRYCRLIYINGAAAQTVFRMGSTIVSGAA